MMSFFNTVLEACPKNKHDLEQVQSMNKRCIQNLQTFYKNYSPISSKYSSTYYSFAYTFLFHLIKHAQSKLNILFTMTPLQMLYDKMVLRTNYDKTLQNYKQNSLHFSTNYRKNKY